MHDYLASHLRLHLLAALMVAVAAALLTSPHALANCCWPDQCDECSLQNQCLNCCQEPPEFWVINTRCAPKCRNLDTGFEWLIYKRYDAEQRRFVKESREVFLAEEAQMPTLFFVHGNGLDHEGGMKNFWQVYHKMRCCPGPKRLVGWSWPAEQVYRLRLLQFKASISKNLRTKYCYAEHQGYYVAKLVEQMSLAQRVMISGHSYGGVTASSALHYLGGGELHDRVLASGAPVERANLRGALISGALDYDFMYPGQRYGQAFTAAEKILVTRNRHDRTLARYPKYTSWRGRTAIGVLGMDPSRLGENRDKLCQMTTYPEVGTSHFLQPHLDNKRFVSAYCCLSFPQCAATEPAEPTLATEPTPVAEASP